MRSTCAFDGYFKIARSYVALFVFPQLSLSLHRLLGCFVCVLFLFICFLLFSSLLMHSSRAKCFAFWIFSCIILLTPPPWLCCECAIQSIISDLLHISFHFMQVQIPGQQKEFFQKILWFFGFVTKIWFTYKFLTTSYKPKNPPKLIYLDGYFGPRIIFFCW